MDFTDDTPTVKDFYDYAKGRYYTPADPRNGGDSCSAFIDHPKLVLLNGELWRPDTVYIAMAYRTIFEHAAQEFCTEATSICKNAGLRLKCRVRKHEDWYWVMIFPTNRPPRLLNPDSPFFEPSDFRIATEFENLLNAKTLLVHEHQHCEDKLAVTRKQLPALEAEKTRLQDKLEQRQADVIGLQTQLQAVLERADEAERLKAELIMVRSDRDIEKDKVARQDARIAELQAALEIEKKKAAENERLKAELTAVKAERDLAKGDVAVRDTRIAELQESLSQAHHELDQADEEPNSTPTAAEPKTPQRKTQTALRKERQAAAKAKREQEEAAKAAAQTQA